METVALRMLDLAGEMLEECFAISEAGDGAALVPLTAEFLNGAGVRMRGEGVRERGVIAEDAGDAIGVVRQRHGCGMAAAATGVSGFSKMAVTLPPSSEVKVVTTSKPARRPACASVVALKL